MRRVLTAEAARELDAHMIENNAIPGILLMENAAFGVFQVAKACAASDDIVIHVFCGVGNNGGDGFAVARILKSHGYSVKIYMIGSPEQLKGDAKTNAAFFLQHNHITFIQSEDFKPLWSKQDIIIDALFGIGLSRDITGVFASVINAINQSGCQIIAMDIPSGIATNTGTVLGTAIKANYTVTFQYPKPAHFLQPGKSFCGEISILNIGLADGFNFDENIKVASRNVSPLTLPKRSPNTHKGSFGTLGLIVSSEDMFGAGFMCVKAALKSGVGLAHLFVPAEKKDAFATAFPEAVLHTQDDFLSSDYTFTAWACGPGLSQSPLAKKLVTKVITAYSDVPKIIDADALNIISTDANLLAALNDQTVLTPHPLEFSRLSQLPIETVLKDPLLAAKNFAKEHNVITLLKLATSVAASPLGHIRLIDAGSPGMARGGSGDVLAGIIGAFLAQGFSALDATVYGAYIAGVAGEMAAHEKGEYSMLPLDSIDMIAKALIE